eukprot:CAMPEP_0167762516 /NCGR_PEP_ID=MMETSP0110_2-20121227/12814_1 /TAXON_ID=629695 /ORGANISM="Gymnochlora sp., Strain CCMP2014" /LENGTH=212 /DNA_ID=CAMNT_0007649405 /DNA_START=171 /DNA_END=807 /DNA_ORIENTATION=-
MTILVPPHPLIKHYLAVARLEMAPSLMTKTAITELGRILMYELLRDWLPTAAQEIQATHAVAEAEFIDNSKPIQIIAMGRVAPVMLEQTGTLLPSSQTYHVGLDISTEGSTDYYLNTLPEKILPEEKVVVVVPEIASHEALDRVIKDTISKGAQKENIRVLSLVVAPPALAKLGLSYPEIRLYCAMIDPEVTDDGRIVPGLGNLHYERLAAE